MPRTCFTEKDSVQNANAAKASSGATSGGHHGATRPHPLSDAQASSAAVELDDDIEDSDED